MQNRGLIVAPTSLYDLLLNSPSAIIGVNALDVIIYATAAIQDILGWSVDELMGQKSEIMIPENLREAHNKAFKRFVQDQKLTVSGIPLRTIGLHKNGSEIPIEITLGSYKTEEGDLRVVSLIRDIKEYVELEEETERLRYQLNYSRSLVYNLGEGLISLDGVGKATVVNPAAEKILGYSEVELVGKDIHDLIHCFYPDGTYRPKDTCEILATVKDNKTRSNQDDFFIRKDGTFANVSFTASPIVQNQKKIGTVVTFSDVSISKLQAQRLADSEERYRSLVENSPDSIAVYDSNGRFIYANKAALDLVGAETLSDVLNRPVMEFIHPGYRQLVKDRMKEAISGTVALPLLHEKILKIDGNSLDVEVASIPINYDGQKSVLVIVRDINERLAYEQQFKAIIDAMSTMVLISKADGETEFINMRLSEFTGMSPEDLKDDWQQIYNPDDLKKITSEWAKALENKTAFKVEVKIRYYDGSWRWVLIEGKPIQNESGQVTRFVVTGTDIDDQKRSYEYKARLAAVVESSENAIYGKDMNGIITLWNAAAKALYGYSAEEIVGQSVKVLMPDDRIPEYNNIMESLSKNKKINELLTLRKAKSGKLIPVILDITPISDTFGKVVGASIIARKKNNVSIVRDNTG